MSFAYKEMGARLSRWGLWGDDDERGALNFITPVTVVRAAASIRSGKVFELSVPLGPGGPQAGVPGRPDTIHLVTRLPADMVTEDSICVSDDFLAMPLQAGTQWDGLAHVGYDGKIYNGRNAETVTALRGATANAIDRTLPGMVGRGVLLDIARLRGQPWLPADHAIGPDELTEAEQAQGVTLGPGDALLVRTGWRRKAIVDGYTDWLNPCPGLTLACAEWIHDRKVAAVASDTGSVEVRPAVDGGLLPLHCVLLRDLGVMLGEIFDLEALAVDCRADGQWDFFFSAPSLRVTGALGSPVSPIAVK